MDKDGERVVKPYAEAKGINYILVLGNDKVVQSYGGIRGIPTTFVIDRKGNIVKKYTGFRAKSVFEKDVEDLLGQEG